LNKANKKLTDKRKAFVLHMARLNNRTQAAIEAGYSKSRAAQEGYELMQDPAVLRELGKARQRLYAEYEEQLGVVMEKLFYALTVQGSDFIDEKTGRALPIHELCERANSVIDGLTIEEKTNMLGEVIITTKLKTVSKSAAMDMALKILGKYAPVESNSTNTIVIDPATLYGRPQEKDPLNERIIELERLPDKPLEEQ